MPTKQLTAASFGLPRRSRRGADSLLKMIDHRASGFSAYPLWIADYSETAPEAPGDWQSWIFWQYSQGGEVAGVDGDVDRDLFTGTRADWKKLLVR